MVDFGYRSIHVTADNGKKIVRQFYSQPAAHSYFVACSTGGRQSLMEAQRFPEDYDGIIAGAPAANWSRFEIGGHMWVAAAFNKDPESYLPASKLKALGDAVNAACDKLDGVEDGVLTDPRKCSFDARALQCPAGRDDASCLTPKQAKAVNDVWAGSRTSKGELIYPGYTRGTEAAPGGWNNYMTGTGPLTSVHWVQSMGILRDMLYGDPTWDLSRFDVEKDAAANVAKFSKTMDAFDPDLSAFRNRGGRLLLYHGFNDPSISPLNTINYYEQVVATVAKKSGAKDAQARTAEFARLFLVPGMNHCGGGPGTSSFDMVTELEHWVEQKQPPESILASHLTDGKVDRTRPLCPYPQSATYKGAGSTDDAANFVCSDPK
jgi:feruloyl esterase